MSDRSSRVRHGVRALLLTPFVATLSVAQPGAPQDQGAVDPATAVSAVVLLNNPNEAALDAAVASRYDASSPNYHVWMTDAALAALAPPAQDVAALQASLVSQGFKVNVSGGHLRIAGSAGQFGAAFGTTVHRYTSARGESFLKPASTPSFRGAHAALIAGVAGVSAGMRPMLVRQIDPSTGQPAAIVPAAAGTDPLASFTEQCFSTKPTTATLSAAGGSISTGFGLVSDVFTGPTYLSTASTTDRPECGYTVQAVQQHYGIDEAQARGLTGRNQTIVIVDAYGSPTLSADANTFSQVMGLPPLAGGALTVVYSNGQPNFSDSPAADWATETTLDVEWAHALAPDARIVVVVAPTQDPADLAGAVEYAAEHHLGGVISNSYGYAEAQSDSATAQLFNNVFRNAAARGIAVNVATGDSGDNGVGSPVGAASIPADSIWGTAVGGTSINIPSESGPVEAAWGLTVSPLGTLLAPSPAIAPVFYFGSGGGESVFLTKPDYQRQLPGFGRQLPDISALADPQTGVIIVQTDSSGTQQWSVIGGTSLATPLFSAIWTLADQAAGEPLGQAAPILGALPASAIRDVLPIAAARLDTRGSITLAGTTTQYDPAATLGLTQTQPAGFFSALVVEPSGLSQAWDVLGFGADSSLLAAPGWDDVTGYGVPNGVQFIEAAASHTASAGLSR